MGYFLVKQPQPLHSWRVSFAAGVLRVSSKLGSSHRTLTTPVEAYAPPCKVHILPFWEPACQHFSTPSSTACQVVPRTARSGVMTCRVAQPARELRKARRLTC